MSEIYEKFVGVSPASREARRGSLPNPELTPGACFDHAANVVLNPGYSQAHRKVSMETRMRLFERYQIPWATRSRYDTDHLVAVSLGGNNDLENLWPHAWDSQYNPRMKALLERRLRRLVMSGGLPLEAAQRALALDWTAAYDRFIGAPCG